jgi:hypothetical protein
MKLIRISLAFALFLPVGISHACTWRIEVTDGNTKEKRYYVAGANITLYKSLCKISKIQDVTDEWDSKYEKRVEAIDIECELGVDSTMSSSAYANIGKDGSLLSMPFLAVIRDHGHSYIISIKCA